MKRTIEETIEARIRGVLLKTSDNMATRTLQMRTADKQWGATEFRAVLAEMIRSRVVWHEDGWVRLLDRTPGKPAIAALPNSKELEGEAMRASS